MNTNLEMRKAEVGLEKVPFPRFMHLLYKPKNFKKKENYFRKIGKLGWG